MHRKKIRQVDSRVAVMNNTLLDSVRSAIEKQLPGQYNLRRDKSGYAEIYGGGENFVDAQAVYSGVKKYHFRVYCFVKKSAAANLKERLSSALPNASVSVQDRERDAFIQVERLIPEGAMKRREHNYALETLIPVLAALGKSENSK